MENEVHKVSRRTVLGGLGGLAATLWLAPEAVAADEWGLQPLDYTIDVLASPSEAAQMSRILGVRITGPGRVPADTPGSRHSRR